MLKNFNVYFFNNQQETFIFIYLRYPQRPYDENINFIILIDGLVLLMRFISYLNKNNIYKHHTLALKFMKELKEPTLKIINELLSLNIQMNKKHFDLYVSLSNNPITLDLPLPHTNKVSNFSKIAGVENLERLKKSGKFIPGCYRIYKDSDLPNICYIGQAMLLGLRVKQHDKGYNKNTSRFCADLGDKGKVDLFIYLE
jgi:hypothetical protein